MTSLIDSGGTNDAYRVGMKQQISVYQSLSASSLAFFYPSIVSLLTPNSFTFDDSTTATPGPDMSMTLETMDNDKFTRYTANILDSTI